MDTLESRTNQCTESAEALDTKIRGQSTRWRIIYLSSCLGFTIFLENQKEYSVKYTDKTNFNFGEKFIFRSLILYTG